MTVRSSPPRRLETVLSEISDFYEISDLLLFVTYSASQSKGRKFSVYFFDVCCAN